MTWQVVLLLFFLGLLYLMALGMPVALAFLITNIVAASAILGFDVGMSQILRSIPRTIGSFSLVPIAFFVLMGEILFHSGLASRTIDALSRVLGRIPGRLGVLTIGGGTAFSVLSGSAIATTSMLTSLMVPEMRRRGYSKSMTVGPVLGAGGLAMVIPPSAMAVLVGTIGGISIGQLLVGGILPGLLLAAAAVGYIILRAKLRPEDAPSYSVTAVPWAERFLVLMRDVLPLGSVVALVIWLILAGIATPTESAALGVVAALLLISGYRSLTFRGLQRALMGTVRITGMILFIMSGAAAYSQILAHTGATRSLLRLVTESGLAPLAVIVLMILAVVVLGAPLEQVSILMITMPIFMPIVHELGYDPVWFGVIMLINMDLANLTPPLGFALYVVKGVAPDDFTMGDIVRAAVPFILIDIVVIGILIGMPSIVTVLPEVLLR